MPTPTTPPSPESTSQDTQDTLDTAAPQADEPAGAPAHAPSFWSSLPGILTGLATVLTAATGLFVALRATSPAIAGGGPPAAPPQAQGSAPAPALRAAIQDPDGFTNLRAAPGTRSAILTRLPQGQSLERLREEDGWWLVRTPEGQTGWVHGSRLKGVP